ncbi:unnamed protein product [Cylicocyclus nassatus]|uniref:Saposin B-type domain-containing protein n=1 Tax=Cylicocyclus nassatus TaxID=53992 RepID=A0AA36MA52_CYLNA|nr:unnamed protein product [Cylicocyclus nassatus]
MLRTLAYLLVILRISEQCAARKENVPHQTNIPQGDLPPRSRKQAPPGSALCRSCEDFLTELRIGAPKKLDLVMDRTRAAAREFLPFYSHVDGVIVDFLSGCVQSSARWIFKLINPRRECTRLMLC